MWNQRASVDTIGSVVSRPRLSGDGRRVAFETNAAKLHGPPGAPAWHLAPVEMAWFDKSSAEICAQIKDPARNGDRTLDEVAEHVRDDPLVGWGWDPGPGREPAPGSAQEAFSALKRWAEAGAPCPER